MAGCLWRSGRAGFGEAVAWFAAGSAGTEFAPVGDGEGADIFGGAGEVGGDVAGKWWAV